MNYKQVAVLSGHNSGIYCLASDGKVLYSGSGDGMLASWDVDTQTNLPFSIKVGKPIYSVLIHNDIILIGQGSGGIHVVDRKSKKEIRHLKFHSKGVFDIQYNSHTNHFYSLGGGGSLSVFDGDDYRLLIQIPISSQKMRKVLLSENGKILLVSSSDGSIHCFETEYFNELYSVDAHENGTYAMEWFGLNKIITGGRDARLKIWEHSLDGLELKKDIPAHNYAIYNITKINTGLIASASRDKVIKIWDSLSLDTPKRLLSNSKTSHSKSVNTLIMHRGQLISASDDWQIRAWSID